MVKPPSPKRRPNGWPRRRPAAAGPARSAARPCHQAAVSSAAAGAIPLAIHKSSCVGKRQNIGGAAVAEAWASTLLVTVPAVMLPVLHAVQIRFASAPTRSPAGIRAITAFAQNAARRCRRGESAPTSPIGDIAFARASRRINKSKRTKLCDNPRFFPAMGWSDSEIKAAIQAGDIRPWKLDVNGKQWFENLPSINARRCPTVANNDLADDDPAGDTSQRRSRTDAVPQFGLQSCRRRYRPRRANRRNYRECRQNARRPARNNLLFPRAGR